MRFALLLCFFALSAPVQAKEWSETDPPINLTHVFQGEINKRGKPVGFHVRPDGADWQTARLKRIISGPNNLGVYTGEAEIFDRTKQRWKTKSFSSFFPDHLDQETLIEQILRAFHAGEVDKRGKWRGRSGAGYAIEGWLCPKGGRPACPHGAINTAYPIYAEN